MSEANWPGWEHLGEEAEVQPKQERANSAFDEFEDAEIEMEPEPSRPIFEQELRGNVSVKRSRDRKKLVAGGVVILLLIVILAAAAGGKNKSQTSNSPVATNPGGTVVHLHSQTPAKTKVTKKTKSHHHKRKHVPTSATTTDPASPTTTTDTTTVRTSTTIDTRTVTTPIEVYKTNIPKPKTTTAPKVLDYSAESAATQSAYNLLDEAEKQVQADFASGVYAQTGSLAAYAQKLGSELNLTVLAQPSSTPGVISLTTTTTYGMNTVVLHTTPAKVEGFKTTPVQTSVFQTQQVQTTATVTNPDTTQSTTTTPTGGASAG
jgi:hypothetical protein